MTGSKIRFLLLVFVLVLSPLHVPSEEPAERKDPAGLLQWIDDAGATIWTAGIGTGEPIGADEGRPLNLPSEFRKITDHEVRVLDGDPIALSPTPGKVLLIDFWATWCKPCMEELPHLRRLYEEERENGLVAIAVNVDEPAEVARGTASRLGLPMPIGLHDPTLDRTLNPRTLPTVVVVDDEGRIRGRWDGYQPGMERSIARRVRSLLADSSVKPRTAGRARRGAGLLEILWHKKLESLVDGIARFEPSPGQPGIAVSHRPSVTFLLADGTLEGKLRAPAGTAELIGGDITGDGVPDLIGFRNGQPRVGIVDVAARKQSGWTTPSRVRDVAVEPGGNGPGTLHVATDRGLILADPGGNMRGGIPGRFVGVGILKREGRSEIVALDATGTIRRGPAGGSLETWIRRPGGVSKLITESSIRGIGLAGDDVQAVAAGAFLEKGGRRLAVATAAGRLVILDPDDGAVLYEARFPGIRRLAAIDLDSDGRDELLLGIGHRLIVLGKKKADPVESQD